MNDKIISVTKINMFISEINVEMRFEVLTAVEMSKLVFRDATSCPLAGKYQRFGETYCLHVRDSNSGMKYPKYGGNMFLRNVGIYLQVHTVSQLRRPTP
jgi:hypothetical protein